MTASDDSDRRSLIDRLTQEPVGPPPEAVTRDSASAADELDPPDAGPPPGATFIVDDDWRSERRVGRSLLDAKPSASDTARRWLDLRGPAMRRALRLIVFGLAVIGAAAGLVVTWFHLTSDPLADVHVYYQAATRLNHGQPLYPAGTDVNTNLAYRYPPLLAVVMRLLALLPYEAFALVWEGVVVLSLVLLVWRLGLRSPNTWLALGLLGIPIGWALSIGQAQVPMTLLMAIGQPWSIALAANLGLFPVLLVVWWIGRRDWEATIAFVFWMVLLGAAQAVLEPRGFGSFLGTVGLSDVGNVNNISPYALSPQLWAALVLAGAAATLALARTRWGWPAAVALGTLASPRLPVYMLTGLLASLREPKQANLEVPEPRPWLFVSGGGRH